MYSVAQTAHGRNATQVHVLPARVREEGAPQQPRAPAHRRHAARLLLLQQELHAQGAPRQPHPVSHRSAAPTVQLYWQICCTHYTKVKIPCLAIARNGPLRWICATDDVTTYLWRHRCYLFILREIRLYITRADASAPQPQRSSAT